MKKKKPWSMRLLELKAGIVLKFLSKIKEVNNLMLWFKKREFNFKIFVCLVCTWRLICMQKTCKLEWGVKWLSEETPSDIASLNRNLLGYFSSMFKTLQTHQNRCKTLFINTSLIQKMYKGIRKKNLIIIISRTSR